MQDNMITLTLSHNHVGQILDGLRVREQAYRDTARYLEYGITPGPGATFVMEEVSDAEEARNLADFYREIIEAVEPQMRTANGRE